MQDFLSNTRPETGLDLALQDYFQIGPRFLDTCRAYYEKSSGRPLRSRGDIESLTELQMMHMHYALSSNLRGRDVMKVIGQRKRLGGGRYLDIGCCMGGSVAAAARAGMDAVGVEIDPQRVAFARENLADVGLPHRLLHGNILDDGIESELGNFDVITCNDVAEHVEDPAALFAKLGRLMNPGGVIYLEVPNKYSTVFAAKDGHFCLFGITLLERDDAREYHRQRFSSPYDVGHYLTRERYEDLFRKNRMRAELIPSLYHATRKWDSVPRTFLDLDTARREFVRTSGNLTSASLASVLRAFDAYLRDLALEYFEVFLNPARDRAARFENKYLREFWTFLASRE